MWHRDVRFAGAAGQDISSCCPLEQKGELFCLLFWKCYDCQAKAACREQQGQCSHLHLFIQTSIVMEAI